VDSKPPAAVAVAAFPVVFWLRVATRAAARVPDEMLLAFSAVMVDPSLSVAREPRPKADLKDAAIPESKLKVEPVLKLTSL
jgi:hypothetical protein